MPTITLRSPAKLNLFLQVLSKRPDGYHELKTLFERIDLCDTLRLATRRDGRLRVMCTHPAVPRGRKNLVYQAADLLRRRYGVRAGADIRLSKKIPVAAGLGGGSSNAATTLLGLNKIWRLGLGRRELLELGARLGSDVPFFLCETSWAIATGRGDRARPLDLPVRLSHVLVVPRIRMSTQKVYGRLNLELTKKECNVNILIHSLRKNNIIKAGACLHNDLEASILSIRPALANIKARLQLCLSDGVAFSGSGPSIFGLTRSKSQVRQLRAELSKRYKQVFAVQTL